MADVERAAPGTALSVEVEIEQQYGSLMDEAVAAFATDIDYLVEMADNGRRIARGERIGSRRTR